MLAKLVLCCGMVRSASTLQYHYAKALVEHFQAGMAIGYIHDRETLHAIPEVEQVEYIVVKNHDVTADLESILNSDSGVAIYSYRDVRDVVVSMMNKMNIPFEDSVKFNLDYALRNFYAVKRLRDPLISFYDDIIADPASEVVRIAEKLSFQIDANLADAIAAEYSLPMQQQRIRRFNFDEKGAVLNGHRYDPITLLNENHIYSGAVNQWQKALNASQIEWINTYCADWLEQVRLHARSACYAN